MRAWLFAGAAILVAVSALAPMARAEGPRPSSENNWPGMSAPNTLPPTAAQPAPHYVWHEGYTHHGRWVGQWVLVR